MPNRWTSVFKTFLQIHECKAYLQNGWMLSGADSDVFTSCWFLFCSLPRPCLVQKNLQNRNSSTFVCIWQILSNHELTRLKRFVSSIPTKLCNYFLFSSIFNTSCMRLKIWCDGESKKFCKFFWKLNGPNNDSVWPANRQQQLTC